MPNSRINIPLLCIVCGTLLTITVLIVSCIVKDLSPEVVLATSGGATTLFGTAGGISTPGRDKNEDKEKT